MKIWVGLLILMVLIWVWWIRSRKNKTLAQGSAGLVSLPAGLQPNDKLIDLSGAEEKALGQVVDSFCALYKEAGITRELFNISSQGSGLATITFPRDIEFVYFCYFVNYLYYPPKVQDWVVKIRAWGTVAPYFGSPSGQRGLFFIPPNDMEKDVLWLRLPQGHCYKFDFGKAERFVEAECPVGPEVDNL